MGGHGIYVWSAYAISLMVMIGLIIKPYYQTKREINHIRLYIKLQQVNKTAAEHEDPDASDS
jgi:heme exporter protein CcmD